MLGKKLYKTSMLNLFRLVILAILMFFLNDFILDTYTYEKFQADGRFKIVDVIQYHYRYPAEAVTFFFLLIVPAEKGFRFNRGLPFMNRDVPYEDVKTYKLLHPQHIITIHTKKGDVFLIADNRVERVIAILDQHNIPGDLARDDYANLITNFRKFVIVVLSFTVIVFTLKKFGFFFR
jgi:hypothetical protein